MKQKEMSPFPQIKIKVEERFHYNAYALIMA